MQIESLDILSAGTGWRNLIVVKLTTDTGVVGYGEATIEYGDRALMAYLPEIFTAVKGRDPRDIDDVFAAMVYADYWRSGFIARTAFSAIELACWDLKGRIEAKPVWQLLGGKRPQPLRAYANGWYRSDRDPERIAELAEKVVARGYLALKIDPFGAGDKTLSPEEMEISLAIIRNVRLAVGDNVELFIEGHGRFDLDFAVVLAAAMEPYRPGFFEEPLIPELNDQLPQLVSSTRIPIALGERLSTPKLFEWVTTGCDNLVLQPDICHIGGINALTQVVHLAESRGWSVAPHNAGSPLATTHAVHLGIASPAIVVQETFDDFEEPWVRQGFAGHVQVNNGHYDVGSEPGFGVTVQEEVLAAHPMTDEHLDLYAEGWEQRTMETGDTSSTNRSQ